MGTCVKKIVDNEKLTFELMKESDQIKVASGGNGGLGNVHFKSAVRVRPLESTDGENGEECFVELELKSIANAGMVSLF